MTRPRRQRVGNNTDTLNLLGAEGEQRLSFAESFSGFGDGDVFTEIIRNALRHRFYISSNGDVLRVKDGSIYTSSHTAVEPRVLPQEEQEEPDRKKEEEKKKKDKKKDKAKSIFEKIFIHGVSRVRIDDFIFPYPVDAVHPSTSGKIEWVFNESVNVSDSNAIVIIINATDAVDVADSESFEVVLSGSDSVDISGDLVPSFPLSASDAITVDDSQLFSPLLSGTSSVEIADSENLSPFITKRSAVRARTSYVFQPSKLINKKSKVLVYGRGNARKPTTISKSSSVKLATSKVISVGGTSDIYVVEEDPVTVFDIGSILVESPSGNLILNGNFEDIIRDEWTLYYFDNFSILDNSRIVRKTNTYISPTHSGYLRGAMYQDFATESDTDYSLRFWSKPDLDNPESDTFFCWAFPDGGFPDYVNAYDFGMSPNGWFVHESENWVQREVYFTTASGSEGQLTRLYFRAWPGMGDLEHVYLDDISVEAV